MINNEFRRRLANAGIPFTRDIESIYQSRINDVLRITYGVHDLFELGALGYQLYDSYGGDQYVNLQNGFSKLIDYFSSQVSANIRLNQRVTNIDYTTNKIQITLAPNPANRAEKSYSADIVVSTIPLGVLKETPGLFTPLLRSSAKPKLNAIKRLGFGTVNKINLVFPSNVFTNGLRALDIFWNQDMPILNSRYNLNGNRFYRGFTNFFSISKTPNILSAFIVGEEAIFSESLSHSTLLNLTYDILSTLFPQLNLPRPINILR